MSRQTMVLVTVMLAGAPSTALAQSDNDIAGWIGLMATPVGGFAPATSVTSALGRDAVWGVRARYGHWQFDSDDDNTTNLALGVTIPLGTTSATVDLGHTSKKECDDCGALLAGVDVSMPLWSSAGFPDDVPDEAVIAVGLNPAAGYMSDTDSESDFSALSAALSVPVSAVLPLGEWIRLVPFVSPGLGWGQVRGGSDSMSGFRPMLGGGVGVGGVPGRLDVTVSFRKVFIEEGVSVYGVSLAVRP